MALHPSDITKLSSVFYALRRRGYHPLQAISYAAGSGGSHYFVFGWFDNGEFTSVAIDFTCQHREGGVDLMPGRELIRARRKLDRFWIPDPAVEFQYLLAKKILKGAVRPVQAERLSVLAREVGRDAAERVAANLVGEATKARVVDACLNNALNKEIATFRRRLGRTTWKRDPLNRFRYWATEGARLYARMLKPTGLFVAVLGPDGVGKSSLLPHLARRIGVCFRQQKTFQWRSHLLWHGKSEVAEKMPERPIYSPIRSVFHLVACALDFSLGYWLLAHPALVQSGLVLFDCHFDDLLIEPKRYGYEGPMWLPRLLRYVIPKPDVLLILDAPADAVQEHKVGLERDDIARQRRAHRDLAYRSKSACIIDATGTPDAVAERAVRTLSDYLTARLSRNYRRWAPDPSDECFSQLQEERNV
jgi:thymidylate kinase